MVDDVTHDSITISWEKPKNASVTSYLLEIKHLERKFWKKEARLPNYTLHYQLKNLSEDDILLVRVSSSNHYGTSAPCNLISPIHIKFQTRLPAPPSNPPEVVKFGDTSIHFDWEASKYHGDFPIIGYRMEKAKKPNHHIWTVVNEVPVAGTEYVVENLPGNSTYSFRVRSINAAGVGQPSPTTPLILFWVKEVNVLPSFKERFQNIRVERGKSAVFSCKVLGCPSPGATWYKDHCQILKGQKHRIVTCGSEQLLGISNVDFEDAGDIECRVKNKVGFASIKGKLDVFEPAKIKISEVYKKGLKYFEGERMEIKAEITGEPRPVIIWTKDGESIENSEYICIINLENFTTLTVYEVLKKDEGIYKLHVNNFHGNDFIDIPVTIMRLPENKNVTNHCIEINWLEPEMNEISAISYIVEKCDLVTQIWKDTMSTNASQISIDYIGENNMHKFRVEAESESGLRGPDELCSIVISQEVKEENNIEQRDAEDGNDDGGGIDKSRKHGHKRNDVLSKYIIYEELGRGAFGVVHRAVERATGKVWAAKFIKCEPHGKEAVLHEIHIMNNLDHCKLLRLHEAFEQPGEIVMILEFLSGGELFDRLISNDYTFTEDDCISYMRQICEGVQHMHHKKIIHLDLKPENVMCVTKDSTAIKLIDFGLAQKIEDGKSIKVLFGTAEFCSPEIINFEPVSFSSDMWSLGVVAYVLLSGYSPFAGDDDQETFSYINNIDYDFDDEVWEYVSETAKDFIASLLIKDKRERMTIDEALNHPWLNPQKKLSEDQIMGEHEKVNKKTELPTENHKEYLERTRNKEKDFDVLPIGCLAHESAVFRREGDDGVLPRELVMEMPTCAPEIVEPLVRKTAIKGSSAALNYTLPGKPEKYNARYKSSSEISSSRRSQVSYNDSGISSLFLSDLDVMDAGSYSCKPTSKYDYGTTSSTSKIDTQEVRHRRRKKEVVDTEARFITYDGSRVDPLSPPVILLPLVDEFKSIGESVKFSITVRSHSDVEVTWSHNEDIIQPSSKYSIKKDGDVYTLHITDLNPNDAGCWRCLAINYYGQAQTSADLTIYNYTLERYRAPKFLRGLHNIVVSEGASVKFKCKITAHPDCKIIWYKNREKLENDNIYKICEEASDVFSLFINEVIREDIGFYMCQAINQAGSSSSEAKLSVETQEKPLSLLGRNPLTKEHSLPPEEEEIGSKYTCMPEFTTKLKNKLGQVDHAIRLSCSVSGVPDPTIQWYKNGEKIQSGLFYVIKNSHGLLTLDIPCLAAKDEGQYVCEATNCQGTVSCSSTISLQGSNRDLSKVRDYETPVFLDTPLCCTVVCGEDAMFKCVATGHPSPSFKWTKDGINVEDNRRCQVFVDSHGACRLVVHKAEDGDSGLYTCTAHNNAGRTSCSTRLRTVGVGETRSRQASQERSYSLQKYEKTPELDVADRLLTPGQPPYFTIMLPKTIELTEGDKLKLDCAIEGLPSPVITWQKGVRQLTYDARHRIIAYGTLNTMEIPSVMVTDRGEYIVRAANVFGIIETSCNVTVNKKSKRGYDRDYNKMKGPASRKSSIDEDASKLQAPFFVKHLPHTIDVFEGGAIRLDCIVKTQKTAAPVEADDAAQSHTTEGGVKSAPKTVEPAHQKVTSSHDSGHHDYDDYHRYEAPTAAAATTTPIITTPTTTATPAAAATAAPCSGEEPGIDPSFTTRFDDIVVTEGDDAVLECKTSGESDVRWLKDGETLASSGHITIVNKGCLHQLHIHQCSGDDEAIYTCISSSGGRSSSCMAMLSTKRNRDHLFDSSYGEDLFKKWETRLYGESYTRPERHSPQRSPERDRRYRSSSQESDQYYRRSRYSESPYNRYPTYGSKDKHERYSRYDRYRRSESFDVSQRSESHDRHRRSESFDFGSDYDAKMAEYKPSECLKRHLRRGMSDSDYSIDTDDDARQWSARGRQYERREERYSRENIGYDSKDPMSPRVYDETDNMSRVTRESLEQKRISDKSMESVEEKYSALTKSLFSNSAKDSTIERMEYMSGSREYKTGDLMMDEDKKQEPWDISYESSQRKLDRDNSRKYQLSYETESSYVQGDAEAVTKKVPETYETAAAAGVLEKPVDVEFDNSAEKVTDIPSKVPDIFIDSPTDKPESPKQIPEKISDIPTEVPEVIADIPIKTPEIIADIPIEVPEKVADIPTEVTERVADIPTEVTERIPDIPTEVTEKVTDIPTEVTEIVADMPMEVTDKVTSIPTEVTERVADMSTEIPEKVMDIPTEVPEKVTDIPKEVTEKVEDNPSEVQELVTEVSSEVHEDVTVITKEVSDISTEVQEMVAEVSERVPEVSKDADVQDSQSATDMSATGAEFTFEVSEESSSVSRDVKEMEHDTLTQEQKKDICDVSTDLSEKISDGPSEMTEEVTSVTTVTSVTKVTETTSEVSMEKTTDGSTEVFELGSDSAADIPGNEPEVISIASEETITTVTERETDTDAVGMDNEFTFEISEEKVETGEKIGAETVEETSKIVSEIQTQEQQQSSFEISGDTNILARLDAEGQEEITVELEGDMTNQVLSKTVQDSMETTVEVTEGFYNIETEVKTEQEDIISGEATIQEADMQDLKVLDVQQGGLLIEEESGETVHEVHESREKTEGQLIESTETTKVITTVTETEVDYSEIEDVDELLASEMIVKEFDDSVEKEIPYGRQSVIIEEKTRMSISPETESSFSFDFVQNVQSASENVASESSFTQEQTVSTKKSTKSETEYEIVVLPNKKDVIVEEYKTFSIPPNQSIFGENEKEIEQLCTLGEEGKGKEISASSDGENSLVGQSLDTIVQKEENTEYGQQDTSEKLEKDKEVTAEMYQQLSEKIESRENNQEIINASEDSLTFDSNTGVVSGSLTAAATATTDAVHEKKPDISTETELHQSDASGEHSKHLSTDNLSEKHLINDPQSDTGKKDIIESEKVEEIIKQKMPEISDIHKEEVSELKTSTSTDDLNNRKNVEGFAESFANKIIEEEMKEKSSDIRMSTTESTKDLKTETGTSDGLITLEQTATIVDVEPEKKVEQEVDNQLKQEYTVEMPVSPDQRNLSVNDNVTQESQSTFNYEEINVKKDKHTVSMGSPVIEEVMSPFGYSGEVNRGIVEEPNEECDVSVRNKQQERVFFDNINFELSNICQDVSEKELKTTDTSLQSNRDVQQEETDYKSTEVREKLEFRESQSDSSSNKAALISHEDSGEFGSGSENASPDDAQFSASKSRIMYSRRTVHSSDIESKGYERSFDEVSGVSSTDDLDTHEEDSKFYRRRTFQRQHTDDQLEDDQGYADRPYEAWGTSEQYETGRKTYKLAGNIGNIGKEDFSSEGDGVWTRKPIFSEDSLSYASEQASVSSESFRGIDTESNRTSSLERQLSEDETFFLRQASTDSDRINNQFSEDINISQRQKFDPEEFFYRQISEDIAGDKQTTKERHSDQRETFEESSDQSQSSKDRETGKKLKDEHIQPQSSESSDVSEHQVRHLHKENEDHSTVTKIEHEEDQREKSGESPKIHHLETAEEHTAEKVKIEKSESQSMLSTESRKTIESSQSPEQPSSRQSKSLSPSQAAASSESQKKTESSQSPEQPSSRKSKSQSPMPQDGAYQIEQLLRAARIKSPTIDEVLKDRQFPPVFVKELPRLLEAKIGETMKMTCVVRYIVKVEWKKMGKKVEKDKRRKMTTDDSGNLTLTIKDVQSGDSGIYSCIATETDGTVTETQCVLIVRGKKE